MSEKQKPMLVFRLLSGQHAQNEPTGRRDENGNLVMGRGGLCDNCPMEMSIQLKDDHVCPRCNRKATPEVGLRKYSFDGSWAGNIIRTTTDLVDRFNSGDKRMDQKFERISEEQARLYQMQRQAAFQQEAVAESTRNQLTPTTPHAPTIQGGDTYDQMTVDELRRHAAEEEIDLGKATKKDDILRLIRAAVVGV